MPKLCFRSVSFEFSLKYYALNAEGFSSTVGSAVPELTFNWIKDKLISSDCFGSALPYPSLRQWILSIWTISIALIFSACKCVSFLLGAIIAVFRLLQSLSKRSIYYLWIPLDPSWKNLHHLLKEPSWPKRTSADLGYQGW